MRILVATDVTGRGGVDTYVMAYLSALRRRGHDPVLLFERDTASPVGVQAKRRGFAAVPLPLYRRWHRPEVVERACRSAVRGLRPDGAHVVTGSPRSCLPLRPTAIELGVPLMITESQVSQEVQLTDSERAAVRASYAAAHAVIFVTPGNRDTMATAVGLDGVRSVVIRNGVDLAQLRPYQKADLRPHTPARLISVARLSPEKSLDTLVTATSLLPKELIHEVNIFGDGPAHDALTHQAARLRLGRRLRLHGWTTAVAPELRNHELFVLPSIAEGMPYALLEAMAVGLPVVSTELPGNTEALADGALGRLVPRSDPQALAGAIRGCLEDPTGTETMARATLDWVRRQHDRAAAMDATVSLWQNPPDEDMARDVRG